MQNDNYMEKYTKYTKEQLKAAYALNLCTVSVSQIIEYNDVNIMEQEYETILNNLNIEHMPKDDALLKILKQLLDTISFFRIQDKEKDIIEKEYQHRVKNAIWSAVPNLSVVVASGNWISMAVSLATQIGTGYMNYRRAKADLKVEMDRKQWELERTALEQFHGLRRELFDTAWRLTAAYNFPDELRLTEKQIKQYNAILSDYDELRIFERLNTIKDNFVAYPPFWYQMGSIANRISQDKSLSLETRMQYKCEAISAFKRYWASNEFPLLREDYIASACALEYAEMLNVEQCAEDINELLTKAEKYSGRSNDILQICAMGYLKIGKREKAAELLRILVNEEYNLSVNSQILSGLYINGVFSNNSKLVRRSKAQYEMLALRVKPEYLLKMPTCITDKTINEVQDEFIERQESLLNKKSMAVIQYYMDKFIIRLGKIIPEINDNENKPDFYFSTEGMDQRLKDMKSLFNSSFKLMQKERYLEKLSHCSFVIKYFEEVNRLFSDIIEISGIRDRNKLREIISDKIQSESATINLLSKKMDTKNFNYNDMCMLLRLVSNGMFNEFITEVSEQIKISVMGMNSMERFAEADNVLRKFCVYHNIPEPNELIEETGVAKSDNEVELTYFGYELLGETGVSYQEEYARNKIVESIIKRHISKLKSENPEENIFIADSEEFNSYLENIKLKNHKNILSKAVAIYSDSTMKNLNLLFTTDGVVPIDKKKIKETIPYIQLSSDEIKNKIKEMEKRMPGDIALTALFIVPAFMIANDSKMKTILSFIEKFRPMIDEIALEFIDETSTGLILADR